jgi:hypothetical protein
MPITEATLLSFHKKQNSKILLLKKNKIYDKQRNVKSYWENSLYLLVSNLEAFWGTVDFQLHPNWVLCCF